ncbi:cache domain-containing protein [Pseudooceanicola sp.]|uniref:cache domain-containing protein n=2 Tax=Pseudooceanicola TaxID=1679449 RepID=UPI0035197A63
MRTSLGAMLAIGLAGLQLLAVLAVVFSSYVSSERALLDHARDLLRDVGANTIEHSRGFLGPARGAAELSARLAQDRVIASDVPELLERLLFQQLQLAPQFAGVYHGNEEGEFVYVMRAGEIAPFRTKIIRVDGADRTVELIWRDNDYNVIERRMDPDDPYDPRTRPWYVRARDQLTTIWTDPYIFFSSRQPGITLASPVMDGPDRVRGIVGVDIEISDISDFLARLRIGATGRALIIHENGDVIAHPNKDLLKAENADGTLRFVDIRSFEDPIARAAFADLEASGRLPVAEETLSQFTYGGETYVSVIMPQISDNLPWTIGAYALESDFTQVLKANRLTNTWIAVFVAAVTGLAGLALANYIYKPVRAFAVRNALVAQGELDPSEPLPKTYQELERANQTLTEQIAARRETEMEYGRTFDMSSRGMAQIDPETSRFLDTNARIREITGYSEAELRGMTVNDLAHPDDPPFLLSGTDPSDPQEINYEMRCLRRDGETIWASVNAILIFNQQGKPLHFVLTLDDITASKLTEEQVAELSKDISNLSRDKTMGQVAAGLAHELNQPLTAIAQNADSALYAVNRMPDAEPELRLTLEEIAEQSIRAGEIIRALRSFIRRDEGIRTDFDLGELVEQTKRLVVAEARAAAVTITSDMGAGLPQVHANRIQIAQVLVNLMRNAIEAVSEKGSNDRRVHVHAALRDGKVQVCVTDTGPGVDPSINLFEDFETTKPAGMGLGLSICRSIVQTNGGRIWHEAAEPNGARFCFTLDIAAG